jgi:hypothetical protein
MSRKCIAVCIVLLGMAVLLLPQVNTTHAQEPAPENDANCVACHEHQYYLYDSGKWFCLCDAPMHCVYCHGGRTDSPVEDIAHEGLVLYPTRDQAERCQACHTEDYLSRVVTFETVAGVSSTPIPLITATPMKLASTLVEEPPSNPMLLRLSRFEPWRLAGLGVLIIALAGIMIFGYRCWKADCLVQSKP